MLEDNTPLTSFSKEKDWSKTEELLKRLQREGYVVKIKEPTGAGDEDVYWMVGPRGKVEVGDEGVKGLTRAVYGELNEAEEEELDRRMERSLGIGREVPSKSQQANGNGNGQSQQKKRGRKRKNATAEEEEEEEEVVYEDDE